VTVFNVKPVITQPSNISYQFNKIGNYITWFITDASIVVTSYEIRQDGNVIKTGSWNVTDAITISVDGLVLGRFNFTIFVYDGLGGIASDTLFVFVTDISAPEIRDLSPELSVLSMCIGASLVAVSIALVVARQINLKKSRHA
jgi:hypothetical protein